MVQGIARGQGGVRAHESAGGEEAAMQHHGMGWSSGRNHPAECPPKAEHSYAHPNVYRMAEVHMAGLHIHACAHDKAAGPAGELGMEPVWNPDLPGTCGLAVTGGPARFCNSRSGRGVSPRK